jgi:hypothetical protein
MQQKILAGMLVVLMGALPFGVGATEAVVARVILVEPTYMPGSVMFQLDKPLPSCPLGTWFRWDKGAENNKAVLSSLLSALISGKRVVVHVNNGDTTCAGQYLHVLNN